MEIPKVDDYLYWGQRGSKTRCSVAMSNLSNNGNFMAEFVIEEEKRGDHIDLASRENKEDVGTSNQLAAKALQLRIKGKHDEAEKLLKEAENIKVKQNAGTEYSRGQIDGTTSRFTMHDVSAKRKRKEYDADLHLAHKIMHNQRYNIFNQADEEYHYDDGPKRKTRKEGAGGSHRSSSNFANLIMTQQDRCQFCFESPARPKHLVIAIANFTYLSLPHRQPVVPGHCSILTLLHESSTRTVEDNVWDEIRNFKKCLIMMFAKQGKDVVFFETVMGLTQQRRHCLVECIPLPQDIAKQAPLYFKKVSTKSDVPLL